MVDFYVQDVEMDIKEEQAMSRLWFEAKAMLGIPIKSSEN